MDNNKVVGCCGKNSVESLVLKFKQFQATKGTNNPFDKVSKQILPTVPEVLTPKTFTQPQLTQNGYLKFFRK